MSLLIRTQKYINLSLQIRRNISHNIIRRNGFSKLYKINTPNFLTTSSNYSINAAISQLHSKVDKIIDQIDYSLELKGRIDEKDFYGLLKEFENNENLAYNKSLLLLQCCGNIFPQKSKEEKLKFANEVWDTLKKKGISFDIKHYNALLKVYLENDYQFSTNEFLNTLENNGIKPNPLTFDRLMTYHCKKGDLVEAMKILELIKEKNIPLNESIFDNLILGHSIAGEYDEAKNLIKLMEENRMRPTLWTHLQLFTGYAKNGKIDLILKSREELINQNQILSDKDLLEIVVTLCESNHSNQIDKILELMSKGPTYNQDAKNTVYNLINLGHYSEAFKVLMTMNKVCNAAGEFNPMGKFFIYKLCEKQVDVKLIGDFCSELESKGFNPYAYEATAWELLKSNRNLETINVFQMMKTNGKPVKDHYFWPFFTQIRSVKDATDILNTINSQFQIKISAQTFREYVFPYIPKHELILLIEELGKIGFDKQFTSYSLFSYWIENGNFSEANKLLQHNASSYYGNRFLKTIGYGFKKNKDFAQVAELLVLLPRNDLSQEHPDKIVVDTLIEILSSIKNEPDWEKNSLEFLKECKTRGIYLKPKMLLRTQVQNKMPESISQALEELTNENNIPKYNNNNATLNTLYATISSEHCDDANQVAKKFEYHLTSPLYALLIELNVKNKNLNATLDWLEKWKNISLDLKKFTNLINFLLENGKIELVLSLIDKKNIKNRDSFDRYGKHAHINTLLSNLPNHCGIEDVRLILEALVKSQIVEPGRINFTVLIDAYLEKDQVNNAIDQFIWCAHQYRTTPNKDVILCKLIEISDTHSLQRIVDILTDIHGYVNSAYDLVINLLKCNRFETAKKLLQETPALRSKLDKFTTICILLRKRNDRETLEKLIEISRGIDYIDPMVIYNELLMYFYNANQPQNALKLWEEMKRENININNTFLITLTEFLKTNNIDTPFEAKSTNEPLQMNSEKNFDTAFKKAILEGNVKEALKERDLLKKRTFKNDMLLIELLLKENETNLIAEIILDNVENTSRISHIQQMLKKISLAGRPEVFQLCNSKIPEKTRGKITFNTFYLEALKMAGQMDNYLEKLENKYEPNNSNSEDITDFTIGFLSKNPEYLDRVKTIAIKHAEKGDSDLINVVWMYYFEQRNDLEASKLWHDYITKMELFKFNNILSYSQKTNDVGLAWKLLTQMQTHPKVDSTKIGYIYSRILNLLVKNEEVDDALSTLNNAEKNPGLQHLQKDCLISLKNLLNQKKIPYELNIPISET